MNDRKLFQYLTDDEILLEAQIQAPLIQPVVWLQIGRRHLEERLLTVLRLDREASELERVA